MSFHTGGSGKKTSISAMSSTTCSIIFDSLKYTQSDYDIKCIYSYISERPECC